MRERWMGMNEEQKERQYDVEEKTRIQKQKNLSETWAQDALQDLEDFIEEQGIYIRQ